MSRHVQDELKHWRKESYRTLEDAEQATGQPWASSSWKEASEEGRQDTLAVCFIAFAALAISLYLLGT
jgi:hypothetical protein